MTSSEPVQPCGTPGVGWWDKVGCYCERGMDPSLWAEPLNAFSNVAFFIAALMAYTHLRAARPASADRLFLALILLTMVVGAGSFLFHTFATRWAAAADVIPIGLFVLAYGGLAVRRFLGRPAWVAVLVAAVVTAATFLMPRGLNGSTLYLPALVLLAATAILLWRRGHRIWPWMAGATAVFLLSLTLRTLDRTAFICGAHAVGSHWAWHVLNGLTLYMLLRAAIDSGRGAQ